MKAVWSWILELCELDGAVTPEEGAQALTDLGLEVEGLERTGSEIAGVIVGQVAWKKPHPNADKLTLVGVRAAAGGPATEVVCGADNVPDEGGFVVWAPPGASLPGGFTLGIKKLKGVESAGMLCAEDELGISDDHGGIIVLQPSEAPEIGADAAAVLHLEQVVFDVSIPANRPDCLGHLGLARELCAAVGGRVLPWESPLAPLTDTSLQAESLCAVAIEVPDACPRYIARIIDGVSVRPSPRWMQQRLRAVGVRPLSNLVDVTNYVMFELGQPLHAFDYRQVRGQRIVVRRAGAAMKMQTLDEIERSLEPNDLLICDGEGPIALAGVMGGLESEVAPDTTRVLLETASFEPVGIRRTARRLGLHSESSHRFERGVDVSGAERASQRAAQLLAELGGGQVAAGAAEAYVRPGAPVSVPMRISRATQLTGVEFDNQGAIEALARLGLPAQSEDDDRLRVEVPSFRGDLEREVDLIEELIRIRGYDAVPATLPAISSPPSTRPDPRPVVRAALASAGLSEAITFGFTSPARVAALRLPDSDRRSKPLVLRNPMSVEQSVMRPSLLPNLLGAVARNIAYGVADVALFEVGTIFLPTDPGSLPDEPLAIAAALTGCRPAWLGEGTAVDFFDLRGAADALWSSLDLEVVLRPSSEIPYLHPGVAAEVCVESEVIGTIGEVHPETRQAFDIDSPVFVFELVPGARLAIPRRSMSPIAMHPASSRDVSFFVDVEVPAARVRDVIAAADEELVERVDILEDFRDPKVVPAGKKGMLWSITYRALDRTLTDREVDAAHKPIVDRLLAELKAEQR